jgi:hypothetical protein
MKSIFKKDDAINMDYPFHSLSPVQNGDDGDHYTSILSWALNNRIDQDIKNIAISGPVGSGKSSALRTFQNRNKNKTFKFLNISLANFKNGESSKINNEKLSRLIELSILQQIFYHEKDEKIPDSRFRKIKSFKRINLATKSFLAVSFIFSLGYIFFNDFFINDILKIVSNNTIKDFLHYTSLFFLFAGLLILFFHSIRFVYNIRINRLKINAAEIEIDKNISKSILNHHLDEILYFFEVTKYNVVIIEDLDRFEETEIFVKLREINLLINNSKKINRHIVFIYAIRDDLFLDDNRTKFFDFIIPLIPIINSSNSNEILLKKKEAAQLKISDDLIENISLFIDDMRLLHNIINEYYIYYLKLNKNLNQNKLLSIIVYKNLYPDDFSQLSRNRGILYSILNKKKDYVKENLNRVEDLISGIKDKIVQIENLQIKNTKELRAIYLSYYIGKLPGFNQFYVGSQPYNYFSFLEEENFKNLISNSAKYSQTNGRTIPIPHNFADIEKEVDDQKTYQQRLSEINDWTNNELDSLRKKIEKLESEKKLIKSQPIKDLLKNQTIELEPDNSEQNKLISILLRNGYIAEDYIDYITIFYEGSITQADQIFLINVKSQIHSEFDYKLFKIDKLISKFNPQRFQSEYILNLQIVDYLLENNSYGIQKENLFNLLKTESENVIKFIDTYIDSEYESGRFIKELCGYWVNIWNYITTQSIYSTERRDLYFKLIIENSAIEDIVAISEQSNLIEYISAKSNILSILSFNERFKNVIRELGIKFVSFDEKNLVEGFLEFILEESLFEINIPMVKLILKHIGKFNDEDFETKNYTAIINSDNANLINNIKDNIEEYITQVYLELEGNKNDVEDSFLQLLNNENIGDELKEQIIKKVITEISDITGINDISIQDRIVEEKKLIPTWNNILNYYGIKENNLTELLAGYLNDDIVAETLSDQKIPFNDDPDSINFNLISDINNSELISLEAFRLISISIPFLYNSFDSSDIPNEKIRCLIVNGKLALTIENITNLKSKYEDLHIQLIEFHKNTFLTNISKYSLDNSDITALLESNSFSSKEKKAIIENADDSLLNENEQTIYLIGKTMLKSKSIKASKYLLESILMSKLLSIEERIKIFYYKKDQLYETLITNFLISLNKPYSDITKKRKRPLIKDNEPNRRMVAILIDQNYISKFKIERKGIRISTYRN